jgi:hypothetical protein
MKILILGFIAFDIAAIYAIVRTARFPISLALVMILLLTNILIVKVIGRHRSLTKDLHRDSILRLLTFVGWTAYIPVFGGMILVFIGLLEVSWQPCAIGMIAIAIGILRISANERVRQALRDRR